MALIEKPEDTESDDQKGWRRTGSDAAIRPGRRAARRADRSRHVRRSFYGEGGKASSAIQVEAVTSCQSSTGFDGAFAVEWNPFLCSIPASWPSGAISSDLEA